MHNLLKQTTYIIILSILLGFTRYFFLDNYSLFNADDKISSQEVETELTTYLKGVKQPELINISIAKSAYDEKLAVFIDAREYADFNDGHIKGAINLPYEGDLDDKQLLDSLFYLDKTLVIYCSGEGCSLSEDLSYELYENYDFYSIVYFEEGYPKWKELNYPFKKGNESNAPTPLNKALFTFIDYLVILSIIFMISFYFNKNYRYLIPIVSRLVLGFIFIYFSWDKIVNPELFAKLVVNYDMIPSNLINVGVLVLPWLEFIIGLCLIMGVFIDTAALISISLLSLFIMMILQAFLRGKSIDCGCLLSDISDVSAQSKRLHMLQRIAEDICFIGYGVIVKYRTIFKGKNG